METNQSERWEQVKPYLTTLGKCVGWAFYLITIAWFWFFMVIIRELGKLLNNGPAILDGVARGVQLNVDEEPPSWHAETDEDEDAYSPGELGRKNFRMKFGSDRWY